MLIDIQLLYNDIPKKLLIPRCFQDINNTLKNLKHKK